MHTLIEYNVIGLMSGTSLDGVDLAYCKFYLHNSQWSYDIIANETAPYDAFWKETLKSLEKKDAATFAQINTDYGHFLGKLVKTFIAINNINADFIASHGHTIFHQPKKKLTVQIGNGSAIAAECGLSVISDFRSLDVALGGQGAPLVPIGDKLLFGKYTFCLNLGGFANISFDKKGKRIAFDVCPVNIVLNFLSEKKNLAFDEKGKMASLGKVNIELLNKLNNLDFYKMKPPKSLGKEWLIKSFIPILESFSISVEDKLRTVCEHIAIQISIILNLSSNVLVTGGGAYNDFLIGLIRSKTKNEFIIPDKNVIEFKEALIFAFLGVLRMRGEINCLKSVTGASRDNSGGAIYNYK